MNSWTGSYTLGSRLQAIYQKKLKKNVTIY